MLVFIPLSTDLRNKTIPLPGNQGDQKAHHQKPNQGDRIAEDPDFERLWLRTEEQILQRPYTPQLGRW